MKLDKSAAQCARNLCWTHRNKRYGNVNQTETQSLVHHSDRGSQYVSIRYSERLAEAEIEPSVGSKGDSYDNALAETINGLYKAEVIHRGSASKN